MAAKLRLLRDHGRSEHDQHVVVGYNSRLDAVQAAVLNVKLSRLAEWTERRREVAGLYRDSLPAEILDWRGEDPATESHHLFPVMVDDRDGLAAHLSSLEIDSGVHYREALCDAKAFAGNGDECPHATQRAARQLSLPIHPHLSGEQVEHVVAGVTGFFEGGNACRGNVTGPRATLRCPTCATTLAEPSAVRVARGAGARSSSPRGSRS